VRTHLPDVRSAQRLADPDSINIHIDAVGGQAELTEMCDQLPRPQPMSSTGPFDA